MKDYKEVADDVFQRSEKIIADNRRKEKKIMKVGSMTACFCLIALLGVGIWQSRLLFNIVPDRDEDVVMSGVSNTANIKSDEAAAGNSHSASDVVTQITRSVEPGSVQTGDTRSDVWLTAEELGMVKPEGAFSAALGVPTFISYQGGFYGFVDTDGTDSPHFAPSEGENLLFNTHYTHGVYLVENHPDWIAIHINGMEVYEKIFEVTFEVDETTYAIAYSPVMNADYGLGDIVLKTEDFTVYEAVKLQGEPAQTKEYIVDILPLLRRERPNLFDGSDSESGDDYADRWQLALPLK